MKMTYLSNINVPMRAKRAILRLLRQCLKRQCISTSFLEFTHREGMVSVRARVPSIVYVPESAPVPCSKSLLRRSALYKGKGYFEAYDPLSTVDKVYSSMVKYGTIIEKTGGIVMSKFVDLKGKKFGKLVVTERAENAPSGHAQWKCKCECGNDVITKSVSLNQGYRKSCGCISGTINGPKSKGRDRLHVIWSTMKQRCYNEKDKKYPIYGSRGIIICDEWRNDFESFYLWAISNGYSDSLSIDRLDVDGNYDPSNCKWATVKEQARNRRTNVFVEINGETKTMIEWAEEYNIKYVTFKARYYSGIRGQALLKPAAAG